MNTMTRSYIAFFLILVILLVTGFAQNHVTVNGSVTPGNMVSWSGTYQVQDANVLPALSGTTGSIGGGALLINQSTSGTATVTGATAGQACIASASDGTDILNLGGQVSCTITAPNTATVRVYALVGLTPPSKTYNVKVLP